MEVVICGGGVIGACTAYYLAKEGVRSTVVERHELANAASGRAGGFLARDWNSGSALDELSERSFDLHVGLANELDGQSEYGFRRIRSHSVTLCKGSSYSKTSHSRLPPWLDGSLVQSPSQIGDCDTNAQLHPYQFCRTLHKVCSSMGVEFMTQCEVTNIQYSPQEALKTVSIKGGTDLFADKVVIAMGPWTGLAKQWFPSLPQSIYGQKAHSITVTPRFPLTPEAIFASYGNSSSDIYPRPDGEAYICGMVESPRQSAYLDPPGMVNPTDGSCKALKDLCSEMSKSLRDGPVNIEQACYLPLTQDDTPIIGEVPNYDGVYVAAGHSCWGILNAPMTGKIIAKLIIDGKAPIDIKAFDPCRFVD